MRLNRDRTTFKKFGNLKISRVVDANFERLRRQPRAFSKPNAPSTRSRTAPMSRVRRGARRPSFVGALRVKIAKILQRIPAFFLQICAKAMPNAHNLGATRRADSTERYADVVRFCAPHPMQARTLFARTKIEKHSKKLEI